MSHDYGEHFQWIQLSTLPLTEGAWPVDKLDWFHAT